MWRQYECNLGVSRSALSLASWVPERIDSNPPFPCLEFLSSLHVSVYLCISAVTMTQAGSLTMLSAPLSHSKLILYKRVVSSNRNSTEDRSRHIPLHKTENLDHSCSEVFLVYPAAKVFSLASSPHHSAFHHRISFSLSWCLSHPFLFSFLFSLKSWIKIFSCSHAEKVSHFSHCFDACPGSHPSQNSFIA